MRRPGPWLRCGLVFVALQWLAAASASADDAARPAESLMVFVQPGVSPIAERFAAETLPELEALAESMGVAFELVDVTAEGAAPECVGITPLIAYQNHLGRSIYQGRYTTTDRVRNFVRTSRFLPQGEEPLVREAIPVHEMGSARVATPIKITPLEGELPGGFDAEGFQREMRNAIADADAGYVMQDRVELGRSDRLFYTDFYPYRSAEGELYLGVAVYSQFHCHEPVFTKMDGSLHGPWDERAAVFAEGYRTMTAAIETLLKASEVGDGFDVLSTGTRVASWDALGLALPAKPEGASAEALANVELVQGWVVDEAAQDRRAAVQFAFPAPLDSYAGEASSVSGDLTLGEAMSIRGMRGTIVADPASVTMGESDLDDAIHNSMLEVSVYPESTFVIGSVESEFDRPRFGEVTAAVMTGTFTMRGRSIPLTVPVSLEAFVADDGTPRLAMDGRWSIRLKAPFKIEGPAGDPPTNDTLMFSCYIVFMPADG